MNQTQADNMATVYWAIREAPKRCLQMEVKLNCSPGDLVKHKCGTAGCVAGWAIALSDIGIVGPLQSWNPSSVAMEVFGLRAIESEELCFPWLHFRRGDKKSVLDFMQELAGRYGYDLERATDA